MNLYFVCTIVLMFAVMIRLIGFIALTKCAGLAYVLDVLSYGVLIGGVMLSGMAVIDGDSDPWGVTVTILSCFDSMLFYCLSCKPKES